MPKLPFISDELLKQYTEEVITKVKNAETETAVKLYSNVIDPFPAVFTAVKDGITIDEWLEREKTRQLQKTLENAIGDFHQKVLGSAPGWQNAGRGGSFDVKNADRKIIAEIKNKHNTMNSSAAEAVYLKLANHLRYDEKGSTAYLVFVVPRRSERFDEPWSPNQHTMAVREDLRKIDGASFYALATGEKDALKMLYEALPSVISELLGFEGSRVTETALFVDLFERAYGK